jgi:hypothetical protein
METFLRYLFYNLKDLLPRIHRNPPWDYWNHSEAFEKEFENHNIISK